MFGSISKICGCDKDGAKKGYEKVPMGHEDSAAMYRLREAVQAVNLVLPTPITLEAAVMSADGVRKLVRGQTLARTYAACMQNLECLARHVPSPENPGLDAVVRTHRDNARRLADACAAALLHMYLSVGATEGTDAFVEHAIRLTAATEVTLTDLALAEKALGLRPPQASAEPAAVPPTRARQSQQQQRQTATPVAATGARASPPRERAAGASPGERRTSPAEPAAAPSALPPCDLVELESSPRRAGRAFAALPDDELAAILEEDEDDYEYEYECGTAAVLDVSTADGDAFEAAVTAAAAAPVYARTTEDTQLRGGCPAPAPRNGSSARSPAKARQNRTATREMLLA